MKRKLLAIWRIIKCKNYLLVTYRDNDLFYDHTMHQNDTVKYSEKLINHYQNVGIEETLDEAKEILGIKSH